MSTFHALITRVRVTLVNIGIAILFTFIMKFLDFCLETWKTFAAEKRVVQRRLFFCTHSFDTVFQEHCGACDSGVAFLNVVFTIIAFVRPWTGAFVERFTVVDASVGAGSTIFTWVQNTARLKPETHDLRMSFRKHQILYTL